MSMAIQLRRLLLRITEPLAFAPPLLARVVIGTIFLHSGWGKLHNLDKVAAFFASLGIPHPELQAPFVACVELGCGALVLVGLATRFAAIPLIGTMAVALGTALAPKIKDLQSLFALAESLYVVLLVGLVVGGAGALSLDRAIARAIDQRAGSVAKMRSSAGRPTTAGTAT